jgi:hypothetical protein
MLEGKTMQYTNKNFGDLKVGDLFWSFGEDCGEMEIAKVKTGPDKARYADGDPCEFMAFPADRGVWVAKPFFNYPVAIILSAMILATLSVVILLVKWFIHKG